ncbi:MAG: lysostaphin resistance A-like protein, partial [Aristaeellaceae bacterium]
MNNPYLKSLMAVMMFLIIQGLGGIATTATGLQTSITALAFTVVSCGLVSCLLLAGTRMVRLQEAFRPSPVSWRMAATALLGFLTGVMGLGLLSEQLDLPDMMENQFIGLSHNPWGILSVCLAGPVLEEMFFREGIQGHIQRAGGTPLKAILASSLLFGLIHINPAQVPFAACIGILLGIVYHKTGHNILLCSLLHIIN